MGWLALQSKENAFYNVKDTFLKISAGYLATNSSKIKALNGKTLKTSEYLFNNNLASKQQCIFVYLVSSFSWWQEEEELFRGICVLNDRSVRGDWQVSVPGDWQVARLTHIGSTQAADICQNWRYGWEPKPKLLASTRP